jgi:ABC-2 type transport system permease protein
MYIGTKFRYANAVTLLLYLVFFVAVIVGSYALPMQTPEQIESGAQAFSSVTRFYPPAQFFTDALAYGDALSWLLLAAVSLILPGAAVMLFAKSYLKINALLSERYTRGDYKLDRISVSGVLTALVAKESKLYFSSVMYVMNTAAGMVMFTIYVVAMAIMGYDNVATILELPGGSDMMLSVSAVVAMFCVGICAITAPSISMEGSSLWILKTMPVRFWDVAKAKIAFNLIVTVPLTVINTAILAVAVNAGWVLFLGLSLALVCFCVLMAVAGLIINLYFPKLDWKNPTQAVKQSASVIISILAGFVVTALCGVGFYFSGMTLAAFTFLAASVLLIVSWVLVAFLQSKGQGLFDEL